MKYSQYSLASAVIASQISCSKSPGYSARTTDARGGIEVLVSGTGISFMNAEFVPRKTCHALNGVDVVVSKGRKWCADHWGGVSLGVVGEDQGMRGVAFLLGVLLGDCGIESL